MGRDAQVTQAGDYFFFAGWRSDPFFFDSGAFNNFQWTGVDFFGDKDICGIALEVPNAALGKKEMSLWARTLISVDGAGWVQTERGARASQTPFLTGEQNEAYRKGRRKNVVARYSFLRSERAGALPAQWPDADR